jgi:hypothetical protein
MKEHIKSPKANKKTKIEKIEELYGKNDASASLEETSAYLNSKASSR